MESFFIVVIVGVVVVDVVVVSVDVVAVVFWGLWVWSWRWWWCGWHGGRGGCGRQGDRVGYSGRILKKKISLAEKTVGF